MHAGMFLNIAGFAMWAGLAVFVKKPSRFDFSLAAALLAMQCLANI